MTKMINIDDLQTMKNNVNSLYEELISSLDVINGNLDDIEYAINTPRSKKNIFYIKEFFDDKEAYIRNCGTKINNDLDTSIKLYSECLSTTKQSVGGKE